MLINNLFFFLKKHANYIYKFFYKLIDNIIIKTSEFILKIIFLIIKKLLTPIRNKIKKLIFTVRSKKSMHMQILYFSYLSYLICFLSFIINEG